MLCPKCKKEIKNNSLKCEHCGARTGSLCTNCGSFNPITATECNKCKKVLLKICSECNSANLPNAKKCRKCGIEFVSVSTKDAANPINFNNLNSQQKVKSLLLEGIKNIDHKIITISGMSGSGKNLIIRTVANELKNANLIWFTGHCTQSSQLSPFGYFQDLLLTFFNINNFCPDTLQFKKSSLRFFRQDFPSLTNSEVLDLLNLLYPDNTDYYENIYTNKAKSFNILKKVIFTILDRTKAIFVVDNFDNIDGMSFDFLKELLNDDLVLQKCKFIFTTQNTKSGLGFIQTSKLNEENYLDLSISPFSTIQIETFFKQYGIKFGKDLINLASKVSNGNPAILEQIALLHLDLLKSSSKQISYTDFDSLIKLRLDFLKSSDYPAYRMLVAMSVLGTKFYPAMLESFDNNQTTEFERIIETLVNKGYINQLTNLSFEFKSYEIWKKIIFIIKNDKAFEEILNILYEIISIYKQSSLALLSYIVQKLNNNDQAFEIWTHLTKQASYIGDIGLYIITQKQALKLIENKAGAFYQNVKKNIYTRVGKLLEPIDHNTAFEYLQNAVIMLEESEIIERIELLGYLASCSMKKGNYWGAIECADSVLNKLPDNMKTEKALIKAKQITPLLKLGNYGQVINTIETEILDEIENLIKKGKNLRIITITKLFETWLSIYFDYTEALIFQGNNKAFDIVNIIYDILEKNNISDPKFICKAHLLLALANTIKGDIKTSNKILNDILNDFSLDTMDGFIVSRWNLIDILNKFFLKDYTTLHQELFEVAAYANNINDTFTKNILKTLLAKILKDNNQTKKALEILEEQVTFFAKEKISTGVLLSWYMIAKIKLITSGTQFALDIADKAIDIAQSPSINNYYFIALFNKLIGEIYLAKQDFESSKVYLEKAIMICKKFDLQFILTKTYLLCAKLYQELALPKSSERSNYIKQALKMFQLAKNTQIVAEQPALQKNIKDDLNILTSFCKLNGIILKKENK